jgi:hypothetical protein
MLNRVLASSFPTCGMPDSPAPFFEMEVGQAPAEVDRAGQAAMRDSTPCKEGGVNPVVAEGASVPVNEGWVTVPSSKKSQAAKSAILENSRVLPPLVKGASRPNPEKGKAPGNKIIQRNNADKGFTPVSAATHTSTSRPARAGPSSIKTKTWYDPDDRDLERGSRVDRTVRVTLPSDVRNATRSTFVDHVALTVGLQALEACGPSAAPHIWNLTFVSKEARGAFVRAGDFFTKDGHEAKVQGKDPAKFWLKIHWVPYQVPMVNALRQLDATEGVKIIAASYDHVAGCEGLQHVRSLLRTVLVEAPDRTKVPYALHWSHEGLSGQALVTMKGRAPVCLRCNGSGHVRKDCTAVRCVACQQWGHDDVNCKIKPGYSAIVRGQTVFDDAAEVIAEDMEIEAVAAPGATSTSINIVQLDCLIDSASALSVGSMAADSADGAGSARNIKLHSSQLEDPGVGTWAERSGTDDLLQTLSAPVSPLSATTSSGNSGGETSDESVAYESPSIGSVSSVGSVKGGAGGSAQSRRRSKRERERLGSTQSVSPLAKKK